MASTARKAAEKIRREENDQQQNRWEVSQTNELAHQSDMARRADEQSRAAQERWGTEQKQGQERWAAEQQARLYEHIMGLGSQEAAAGFASFVGDPVLTEKVKATDPNAWRVPGKTITHLSDYGPNKTGIEQDKLAARLAEALQRGDLAEVKQLLEAAKLDIENRKIDQGRLTKEKELGEPIPTATTDNPVEKKTEARQKKQTWRKKVAEIQPGSAPSDSSNTTQPLPAQTLGDVFD